jgi:hypothetical protein
MQQKHVGFIHWRNIVAISDIPPERLGKVTHVTDQIIVPKAGQAVFAVSAEVNASPGLENALYRARGEIIEAACNLTMQQLHELSKLRYPGKPAVKAVGSLVEDLQRFVDISSKLIERRRIILGQIVERRRMIAERTASAENSYQKMVKSGLGVQQARLHAPEFDATQMLAAITKMEQEVSAIETFLGVGSIERLPNTLKP